VRSVFRKARVQAGLEKRCTPHSLRPTFKTRAPLGDLVEALQEAETLVCQVKPRKDIEPVVVPACRRRQANFAPVQ
jgi:hypothetical protein